MKWRPTRLRYLVAIPVTNGLGLPGEPGEPDWPRYIRTTDIAGPRALRSDVRATQPPGVADRATVEYGDLLFCCAGSLGISYLHLSTEPACYAGYLARARLRSDVDARFVAYWAESADCRRQITVGAVRSTIDNFSARKIANLAFAIPDFATQRAIADMLDGECERIQLLSDATVRLVATIHDQQRETFDRVTRDVGLDARKLKFSVASVIQGWSPECDAGHAEAGAWGVLKVGAVNYGEFHADEHKALPADLEPRPDLQVHPGDVLMSRANTRELVGSVARVDTTEPWRLMLSDKLYRLDLRADQLDPEFAVQALNGANARAQIETATTGASSSMQNISQELLRNLVVPIAPIEQQRAIAAMVRASQSAARQASRGLAELQYRLSEYRDALITEAVTGKLDVTKLSDAQLDESAHAALEGETPEVLAS